MHGLTLGKASQRWRISFAPPPPISADLGVVCVCTRFQHELEPGPHIRLQHPQPIPQLGTVICFARRVQHRKTNMYAAKRHCVHVWAQDGTPKLSVKAGFAGQISYLFQNICLRTCECDRKEQKGVYHNMSETQQSAHASAASVFRAC